MKKILILILIAFSFYGSSQDNPWDTVDVRLVPRKFKIDFREATYHRQNIYTDGYGSAASWFQAQTQVDSLYGRFLSGDFTPGGSFSAADSTRVYDITTSRATSYSGIYDDGTEIDQASFAALATATQDRTVFWPKGTYSFAEDAVDTDVTADIDWIGEGDNTVFENFDQAYIKGSIRVRDMKFKDSEILFRWDNMASTDTVDHFIVENVTLQNVKALFRNSQSTFDIWPHYFKINGLRVDTVGTGGFVVNASAGAGFFDLQNIEVNGTIDSTWTTLIFLSSGQGVGNTADSSMYLNNISFNNMWSAPGYQDPTNIQLIYAETHDGTPIYASNIRVKNTDLPSFYFNGAGRVWLDKFDIHAPSLRSDLSADDYSITIKSKRSDHKYSAILSNSTWDIPDLALLYKENEGDLLIDNSTLKNKGTGNNAVVRVSVNESKSHENTVTIRDSRIINGAATGRVGFYINADVDHFNMINSYMDAPESYLAPSVISDTMLTANFISCKFYGGFTVVEDRYLKYLNIDGGSMTAHDERYGFSSLIQSTVNGTKFYTPLRDSAVAGSGDDVNFYCNHGTLKFINSDFFLNNLWRFNNTAMGNLDSLILINNNYQIYPSSSGNARLVRVAELEYLKMSDITFSCLNGTPTRVVSIDGANGITDVDLSGVHTTPASTYFFDASVSTSIPDVRYSNITGSTDMFENGDITSTLGNYVIGKAVNEDGNSYLNTSTGYTKTQVDSALVAPPTTTLSSNYELTDADAGKTFFVSANITITLPSGLSWGTGQYVTIIRTEGVTASMETSAVTVKYPEGTSAEDAAITKAITITDYGTDNYIRVGE